MFAPEEWLIFIGGVKSSLRTFEELECWKAGRELRLFVARKVVPILPPVERHRLGDQLLRAARSITANIAEGYGRFHYLDNSKFCSNARGSCTEVLDHLISAADEGLISEELLQGGRAKVVLTLKLLNGYMAYLKHAADSKPPASPARGTPPAD